MFLWKTTYCCLTSYFIPFHVAWWSFYLQGKQWISIVTKQLASMTYWVDRLLRQKKKKNLFKYFLFAVFLILRALACSCFARLGKWKFLSTAEVTQYFTCRSPYSSLCLSPHSEITAAIAFNVVACRLSCSFTYLRWSVLLPQIVILSKGKCEAGIYEGTVKDEKLPISVAKLNRLLTRLCGQ